tara:strand:- start:538 stop:5352 length:4815 start_codon:yes stop_codon:yes gene_type:complete
MAIFSKITSRNTHNSSNGTVKKQDVVFDTSISPTFSDLSQGQDDNILIKGGVTSFSGLIDLPTAIPPNFGESTVVDYQLGLSISSLVQAPSSELGEFYIYKAKEKMGNNEGDMSLEHADLMVYSSYVDDEPHTKFWKEDFEATVNFDEEIKAESSMMVRKTNPWLYIDDAMDCMELSLGKAMIKASGKGSGFLGAVRNGLEWAAGKIVTAAQPQVINRDQMAKHHATIPPRGRTNESIKAERFLIDVKNTAIRTLGGDAPRPGLQTRRKLPIDANRFDGVRIPLKTDPIDPQYWIPSIDRTPTNYAYQITGFKRPRWKKSKDKVRKALQWRDSETVPKTTDKRNEKIIEENTFFDLVRDVRDIKFSTGDPSGDVDETEFANSRISLTQGVRNNALLLDQWINYAFANDATNGTIDRQPTLDFGLDVNTSSVQAQQNAQDIFVMKKIPKPVRLTMDDVDAQTALSEADAESALSSYYHIDMDVNFKSIEPMYSDSDSGVTAYGGRGFYCIFSTVEPDKGETLASYLIRAIGKKTATTAAGITFTNYSRTSNVVTITASTSTIEHLRVGQFIKINGTDVSINDGTFQITSIPSTTTFTYTDVGSNISSVGSGGNANIANGPTCGFAVLNHAGKTTMKSLNCLKIESDNSIPRIEGFAAGEELILKGADAVIPQDTWLNIKIMTDEEGPFKTGAGTVSGVFEVLVSDKDGKLLHDEVFRLLDTAADLSHTPFKASSIDSAGPNAHAWPQYMTIWQQNFPSRAAVESGSGLADVPSHSGRNDTGVTKSDNNLVGDAASAAAAQVRNRKTRMTTCIDHIHINGAGHTKYALLANDNVRTQGEGYVTKNTAITSIDPDFTNLRHVYGYSPCTLSFGFRNKQHLETVDGASKSGHFLFSGFKSSNISDRTAIPDNNLAACYNLPTIPTTMGQQAHFDMWKDHAEETGIDIQDDPSYTDDEPIISVGYDATHHKHAVESFTQKGTILFKEGTDNRLTQSGDEWTKRENIYCSSRITKIIDPVNGVFEIDDTKILEADIDERYIIYCQGDTFQTADQLDADGNNGNNTWVAPVEIINVEDRKVNIVAYTDENEGTEVSTFANLLTENKLSRLMISPYRYWVLINIIGNNKFPERSYNSVIPVNAFSSPGATFNESDFYSVVDSGDLQQYYYNSRNFNLLDDKTSGLVLSKDYGFGAAEDEGVKGGYVGTFAPDSIGLKLIDLPFLHTVDKPEEDSIQTFYITSGPSDIYSTYFYSSNYTTDTTQRPFLVTRFRDGVPEVNNFKVIPDEESDGFYPRFKWETTASDIWYGFLSVSNNNIYNQYTGAVLHFPLNEEGVHNTAASVPTEFISGTTNTISGPLYDLEGLAGNALRFDGNDDYVECNNGAPNDPTGTCTTEMSVVAHIIPDSGANDQQYVVAQASRSNLEKFHIRTNTSNQVEARVHYGAGSSYVDVTSGVAVVKDGEQPTVIMLTVDTTLSEGNVKLFVNGKLEAQSGVASTSGSTTAWKIGQNIHGGSSELYIGNSASSGSNGFAGLIEEVVVYDTCLYPVDVASGEAVIKKEFSELTASALATSKPLNARLFIKDYHNIRGSVTSQVCTTPQVSWRKAGFRLDMS